jgi:prepilin-type N-terminal cleavage/methylation domain-containing protein
MLNHMKRGFTVVEILITLVVMAILLGLSTVGMRAMIANGNDSERANDIATIARGLEQYYDIGNPFYIPSSTKGSYPGVNMNISMDGSGWCDTAYFKNPGQAALYSVCRRYWTEALPGTSESAFTPPGMSGPAVSFPWLVGEATPVAIMNPWIMDRLNEGRYVYKPLNDDNSVCYGETTCRRYALMYKKETTGEIVTVMSRHQ